MTISKAVEHMGNINKIDEHKKRKINDEYGTPKTSKDQFGNLPKKKLHSFEDAIISFNVKPIYDYCASNVNHVCKLYYTKKDNALTKDWVLDGFCNFPYSQQYKFMKKAWNEHQKNNIELLILAYSKTDTRWWHEFVEDKAEIHFVKGRIQFLNAKGLPTENQSPYPSCWIIYRKRKNNV